MRLLIFAFLISSLCSSAYSQSPELMDQFRRVACDEYLAHMAAVISAAEKNLTGKIYFIMYEGPSETPNASTSKITRANPVIGSFNAKVRSMKKFISLNQKALTDFIFVDGGFREEPTVEVWIVPKGTEPPKPTPTVDKIKFRKGKAPGFCTQCCGPD